MRLVTSKIAEVTKSVLVEFNANPAGGRFDNVLDEDFVDAIAHERWGWVKKGLK